MVAFMLRSIVLTSRSYLLNILNSMNLQTILNIRAAALWLTEAARKTVDSTTGSRLTEAARKTVDSLSKSTLS